MYQHLQQTIDNLFYLLSNKHNKLRKKNSLDFFFIKFSNSITFMMKTYRLMMMRFDGPTTFGRTEEKGD